LGNLKRELLNSFFKPKRVQGKVMAVDNQRFEGIIWFFDDFAHWNGVDGSFV